MAAGAHAHPRWRGSRGCYGLAGRAGPVRARLGWLHGPERSPALGKRGLAASGAGGRAPGFAALEVQVGLGKAGVAGGRARTPSHLHPYPQHARVSGVQEGGKSEGWEKRKVVLKEIRSNRDAVLSSQRDPMLDIP